MKVSTSFNVFMALALVASFSALAACAPKSTAKKFNDRGSNAKDSDARDLLEITGKVQLNNEASKDLADQIVKMEVVVKKARSRSGEMSIDELLEKTDIPVRVKDATLVTEDKGELSAEEPKEEKETKEEAPKASAVPEREAQARAYLIQLKINLVGIGDIELAGVSKESGADSQTKLFVMKEDCATKLAGLRITASCDSASCNKVVVEIENTERGEQVARVQKVFRKEGESKISAETDLEKISYNLIDRSEELIAKDVKVEGVAACQAAKKETPAKTEEEAAKPADEKAEKPAKSTSEAVATEVAAKAAADPLTELLN